MASAAEQMAANLNWGTLGKATELRQRIFYTLGLLIIYRIGTYIPVPGIDAGALRDFMEQAASGIGGILSMFTGGALGRMGVFSLGIMPYISASIIVQLLASMWEPLKQLKKEGEQGRKKINQYTRYGTVLLATGQAFALANSLVAGDLVANPGPFFIASAVVTLVGGTMFLIFGILSALYERQTSGLGQVVDAAMVDGASALMGLVHSFIARGQWVDRREANILDGGAPFYRTYECKDGRFLAVGPKTRDEWAALFDGSDACATPVLTWAEAPMHPHMAARGTFVTSGGVTQAAPAPRFSRSQPGDVTLPPAPGGDTDAVLSELGYDDGDLARLRARGVLT